LPKNTKSVSLREKDPFFFNMRGFLRRGIDTNQITLEEDVLEGSLSKGKAGRSFALTNEGRKPRVL